MKLKDKFQSGVPRFLKGMIPILIVCLFLWGLMQEPSPRPMNVVIVFAACGVVLWFGWNAIRKNLATKWLSWPLVVLIGLVLGMVVFGAAIHVAVYLLAAFLMALPYLIYDLLFRAPHQGEIERESAE